jgi:hypothetical protein
LEIELFIKIIVYKIKQFKEVYMSKKSILWIIALILGAAVVLAIINGVIKNDTGIGFGDKVETFNAVVLENNKTSLMVEPLEGEDELRSSDKISVSVVKDGAVFEDLSSFKAGSTVKITYDGTIMESYPAQIRAMKVEAAK